ncbi:MAG: glycerophosphodiester phosphodiesterase [Lachnospiraceae bacterium]|nr:glycerophosphodiester phosphodiesterase [Lachnospiraceae bacterium]
MKGTGTHVQRQNMRTLLLFEMSFRLLTFAVMLPVLNGLLHLMMGLLSYSYLTIENVFSFFLNPISLAVIVFLLWLAAVGEVVEWSAALCMRDHSLRGERIHLPMVARFALGNTRRALKKGNRMLFGIVAIQAMMLQAGSLWAVSGMVGLHAPVRKALRSYPALGWILLVLAGGCLLLTLRTMYLFEKFTREKTSFLYTMGDLERPDMTHLLRRLGWYGLLQATTGPAMWLLYKLFLQLTVRLTGIVNRFVEVPWAVNSSIAWFATAFCVLAAGAVSVPVYAGVVDRLFIRRYRERGREVRPVAVSHRRGRWPSEGGNHLVTALLWIGSAAALIMSFQVFTGRLNPKVDLISTLEVTAHRGASALRPENTMAAFECALELGADWIELDVQQTRDGQIVVVHDSNLRRVTGLRASTWNLEYRDIAELDAGSHFSPEYAGERIPLFSTVLEFARENDVRLNVELKPTGHETDFEDQVVSLIQKAEMEDRCVITSQVYRVLERIKEIDPQLQTVYVMKLAYGNVNKLTAADHFSVSYAYVTRALVKTVHQAGKQLYAWTVNSPNRINRMIELGVDNIITDDIELARECIYKSKFSDIVEPLDDGEMVLELEAEMEGVRDEDSSEGPDETLSESE